MQHDLLSATICLYKELLFFYFEETLASCPKIFYRPFHQEYKTHYLAKVHVLPHDLACFPWQ